MSNSIKKINSVNCQKPKKASMAESDRLVVYLSMSESGSENESEEVLESNASEDDWEAYSLDDDGIPYSTNVDYEDEVIELGDIEDVTAASTQSGNGDNGSLASKMGNWDVPETIAFNNDKKTMVRNWDHASGKDSTMIYYSNNEGNFDWDDKETQDACYMNEDEIVFFATTSLNEYVNGFHDAFFKSLNNKHSTTNCVFKGKGPRRFVRYDYITYIFNNLFLRLEDEVLQETRHYIAKICLMKDDISCFLEEEPLCYEESSQEDLEEQKNSVHQELFRIIGKLHNKIRQDIEHWKVWATRVRKSNQFKHIDGIPYVCHSELQAEYDQYYERLANVAKWFDRRFEKKCKWWSYETKKWDTTKKILGAHSPARRHKNKPKRQFQKDTR